MLNLKMKKTFMIKTFQGKIRNKVKIKINNSKNKNNKKIIITTIIIIRKESFNKKNKIVKIKIKREIKNRNSKILKKTNNLTKRIIIHKIKKLKNDFFYIFINNLTIFNI